MIENNQNEPKNHVMQEYPNLVQQAVTGNQILGQTQPMPTMPYNTNNDSKLHPDDKTKKGFWKRKFGSSRLKKPGFVAVIFLHENRNAELMIVQTEKGFFKIKGKTYHERDDCTFTIVGRERYPLAIIKEWAVTPEGTHEWDEKDVQEKIAQLQDHAIKGIRHAERVRLGERNEMKLNGKAIIGIGIAVIIAIAFLVSYL